MRPHDAVGRIAGLDFLTILGEHEGEGLVADADAEVAGSRSAHMADKGQKVLANQDPTRSRSDERRPEMLLFCRNDISSLWSSIILSYLLLNYAGHTVFSSMCCCKQSVRTKIKTCPLLARLMQRSWRLHFSSSASCRQHGPLPQLRATWRGLQSPSCCCRPTTPRCRSAQHPSVIQCLDHGRF